MPKKPTVKEGPAAQYARSHERIVEFSDGKSGGLISLFRNEVTGTLRVDLYRLDPDVEVVVEKTKTTVTVMVVEPPNGEMNISVHRSTDAAIRDLIERYAEDHGIEVTDEDQVQPFCDNGFVIKIEEGTL